MRLGIQCLASSASVRDSSWCAHHEPADDLVAPETPLPTPLVHPMLPVTGPSRAPSTRANVAEHPLPGNSQQLIQRRIRDSRESSLRMNTDHEQTFRFINIPDACTAPLVEQRRGDVRVTWNRPKRKTERWNIMAHVQNIRPQRRELRMPAYLKVRQQLKLGCTKTPRC